MQEVGRMKERGRMWIWDGCLFGLDWAVKSLFLGGLFFLLFRDGSLGSFVCGTYFREERLHEEFFLFLKR